MTDARSPERIRAHYLIEVELADRLRDAPPEARRQMYGDVYDELFRRVHDHPQVTRRTNPAQQSSHGCEQARLIAQFLPRGGHYVEVGAGDCATARHVAAFAGQVTAVEVSGDIVPRDLPANVQVALSDGVSIPVADASADVVYSNQLMEHLHPDDAAEQLANIAVRCAPAGGTCASRQTASAGLTISRRPLTAKREASTCASTPTASSVPCFVEPASGAWGCSSRARDAVSSR